MEVWVNALRSGKYQQGKKRLKTDDQFCCLGVLCDISGLSEWKKRPDDKEEYLGAYALLNKPIMDWSGMQNDSGYVSHGINYDFQLTNLNDKGSSFAELADIIEKNWEKL